MYKLHSRVPIITLFFTVLLSWTIQPEALAQEINPVARLKPVFVARLCLADIVHWEEPIPVGPIPGRPIPVGCEVIDCCPGCPGPGPIDWRIKFQGGPIESVVLRFEGLTAEAAKKIQIKGNARWAEENQLVIGKGETILSGFLTDPKSRPPVAFPRIEMDKEKLNQILKIAAQETGKMEKDDAGGLEFIVEQTLGPIVVNEYALVYRFRYCFPPRQLTDKIDLNNNANNDSAVVFLDAPRTSLCVNVENDTIYRGNDIIGVGNVLPNSPACTSEVSVFSDGDAMQFISPVTVWTNAGGDILPVDMTPDLLQAPVSVWIATDDNPATAVNETLQRAQADIAQSNNLFNTNHAGVLFNANYQNVSGNAASVATIGIPSCSAANIAALQGSAFYNANQFNVYYVNIATTGYNCINDRNMIVVGTGARPATLAHEIGHAFSLAHVTAAGVSVDYNGDGNPDFANTNVMWGGGIGRTTFSEAQAFRMNLNPGSLLNVNLIRTGSTRTCADNAVSVTCPWLGLDAIPN